MKEPMHFSRVTLSSEVRAEGLGLHSGVAVTVRLLPSDAGLRFRAGHQVWTASPDQVTDTTRCTRLGEISTVEHLMSALAGLGVTDLEVEVSGGEMPALDGAARAWVDLIRSAGLKEIGALTVTPPYARIYDKGDAHSLAIGAGQGHWRYDFTTGDRWPGNQSFEASLPTDYEDSIAPARTFAFAEEVETLRRMGLGLGLDLETALILDEFGYRQPSKYPDEPARHKMLDVIGDLYLSGVPIGAVDVIAERSGHTANVRAAAKLLAASVVSRS